MLVFALIRPFFLESGYQRFSPLACQAREDTRRVITSRKSVTDGAIRIKCARLESRPRRGVYVMQTNSRLLYKIYGIPLHELIREREASHEG